MFKKTELLNPGGHDSKAKPLQLNDLISSVEKYYSPETKLEAKLTNEQFQLFLKHNPSFLSIQKKANANKSIQDVS